MWSLWTRQSAESKAFLLPVIAQEIGTPEEIATRAEEEVRVGQCRLSRDFLGFFLKRKNIFPPLKLCVTFVDFVSHDGWTGVTSGWWVLHCESKTKLGESLSFLRDQKVLTPLITSGWSQYMVVMATTWGLCKCRRCESPRFCALNISCLILGSPSRSDCKLKHIIHVVLYF